MSGSRSRSPISRRISRGLALLRYHKPKQFAWRFYRRVQSTVRRKFPSWPTSNTSVPSSCRWRSNARDLAVGIADRRRELWPRRSKLVGAEQDGSYTFLNRTIELQRGGQFKSGDFNWRPEAPRLWLFHLQCMETMLERRDQLGEAYAMEMVHAWISEARHRSPNLDVNAWHPFCISRRLPVWLFLEATLASPEPAGSPYWSSVSAQATWLAKNCEWDLGGNHLLENLTALYLCGGLLDASHGVSMDKLERWLIKELDSQVLSSGEHFERSPTYHALMVVCVAECLEVARFGERPIAFELAHYLQRMRDFLRWIRQPDGNIPLFGDSALDETPDLEKLIAWCDELLQVSPESLGRYAEDAALPVEKDYWKAGLRNGDQLLFDHGEMACDHLPAHGHADLLQVVASFGGEPAIVDTGNAEYEPGELRLRCRSTSSHNVMQLGSQELCDHWGSFRMGKRGHVTWKESGESGSLRWCAAKHDAYDAETGRVVLATDESWLVLDWFQGARVQTARSRLHLHPRFDPEWTDAGWIVRHDGPEKLSRCIEVSGSGAKHGMEPSIYCPEFGCVQESNALIAMTEPCHQGWLAFGVSESFRDENGKGVFANLSIKQDTDRLSIESCQGWVWQLSVDSGQVTAQS